MFFKYQILCLEFNVNFKIPFFLLVNIKLNEEPENLILLPWYQRKILAVGTDLLLKVLGLEHGETAVGVGSAVVHRQF